MSNHLHFFEASVEVFLDAGEPGQDWSPSWCGVGDEVSFLCYFRPQAQVLPLLRDQLGSMKPFGCCERYEVS